MFYLTFDHFFTVKAVARRTQAAFFYTSASKLVNKTSGPRVVRELFKLANQNAPSIVFIDEIDAVGTRRSCMEGRNGEREIQRTMLGNRLLLSLEMNCSCTHIGHTQASWQFGGKFGLAIHLLILIACDLEIFTI